MMEWSLKVVKKVKVATKTLDDWGNLSELNGQDSSSTELTSYANIRAFSFTICAVVIVQMMAKVGLGDPDLNQKCASGMDGLFWVVIWISHIDWGLRGKLAARCILLKFLQINGQKAKHRVQIALDSSEPWGETLLWSELQRLSKMPSTLAGVSCPNIVEEPPLTSVSVRNCESATASEKSEVNGDLQ